MDLQGGVGAGDNVRRRIRHCIALVAGIQFGEVLRGDDGAKVAVAGGVCIELVLLI